MRLSDLKKAMKQVDLDEMLDTAKEWIHEGVENVKDIDYAAIKASMEETLEQVKNIDMEEVKEQISELIAPNEKQEEKINLVEALRVLYILITIDQKVDARETFLFKEIYQESGLPEQVWDSILFEGKQILNRAKEKNSYQEIEKHVIQLLTTPKAGEHKVKKEWLLWKMLSIAYIDGQYDLVERKLIYAVCETLKVADSLLIEMEDTINHRSRNELNEAYMANIEKWNQK
ncbi:MAG: hypothetical protein Q4C49_03475 [Bacillota bacterium]|nr:hypothetical protein [Bacillota bacterium]